MPKREDYISWDEYFMGIALLSARRSKDPNTQVGACIVNGRNKIMSVGYNGFPQGCSDDEIQMLCDHAMCGDRGIAESFGCELDLPATIAKGDDVCKIRFVRRKK